MLIALLAVLGVDLIVVVALLALVLSRKRWVMRQPGAFRGAIRLTGGEIDGLRPRGGRGYGHWVRDVLVWTKAPLLFRNELIPTDGVDEQHPVGLTVSSVSAITLSSYESGSATQQRRLLPGRTTASWSSARTANPRGTSSLLKRCR